MLRMYFFLNSIFFILLLLCLCAYIWILYSWNINPVSYTHLDVYKRQILKKSKINYIKKILICCNFTFILISTLTLNVYFNISISTYIFVNTKIKHFLIILSNSVTSLGQYRQFWQFQSVQAIVRNTFSYTLFCNIF